VRIFHQWETASPKLYTHAQVLSPSVLHHGYRVYVDHNPKGTICSFYGFHAAEEKVCGLPYLYEIHSSNHLGAIED
jgi:hypothetical protein